MELEAKRLLLLAEAASHERLRLAARQLPRASVLDDLDTCDQDATRCDAIVVSSEKEDALWRRVTEVRSHIRFGLLPLIVFTGVARSSIPESCCDTIVPGPFDAEKLEAILPALEDLGRAVHEFEPIEGRFGAERPARINVLRFMTSRRLASLDPAHDPHSPFGYAYPVASAILGGEAGAERSLLMDLRRHGHLDGHFVDKIHLCPDCGVCQINFRQTCRACGTADIHPETAIHHYRCAFVGPKNRFESPRGLTCPKCQRELGYIGVEYEEIAGVYLCEQCQAATPDPPVECLCLKCGQAFEPECARVEVIESYTATDQGKEFAFSKFAASVHRSCSLREITDWDFLVRQIKLMRAVGRRYGRAFSIVHLKFVGVGERAVQVGLRDTREMVTAAVKHITGSLRRSDVVGRRSDSSYFVLLTETPREAAETVVARTRDLAAKLLRDGLRLKFTQYSYASTDTARRRAA